MASNGEHAAPQHDADSAQAPHVIAAEDNAEALGAFNVVQAKPQVLRVKRRLDTSAPEHIIIEAAPSSKRSRSDALSSMMATMGLAGQPAAAAATADNGRQRRRFLRISTLSTDAIKGKSSAEVLQMVQAQGQVARAASRAPPKTPVAAVPAAGSNLEKMRQSVEQARQAAKYKQVGRAAAEAPAASAAAAAPDALRELFNIYDIVALDEDSEGEGGGSSGGVVARAERARRKAEQAAAKERAARERALMMNYLPMVREYLKETGQDVGEEAAADGAAAAPGGDEEMAADEDAGSSDDFVYDVYIPVEDDWSVWDPSTGAPYRQSEGSVPVIAVDEEELVNWGAEAGADHDSDDSNAESFYGNSYPDEDLYQDSSSYGDENEFRVTRRGFGSSSDYDAAEYSDSDGGGGDVREPNWRALLGRPIR